MEDRIPSPGQQGRILITPEDGSAPYYATVTMADNPTNPGTPLNKSTLLQDQTEVALFGTANNRTVDEAFRGIANKLDLIMGDQAALTLTVQDSAGNGIPDVLIGNMFDENGDSVYTNASGVASGYVAEGSVILTISGYADIENYSESIEVTKGETYSKVWTVNVRNFIKITSTQNIKFSGNVISVDVDVLGGGGGGSVGSEYGTGSNYTARSGSGGAGGDVGEMVSIDVNPNEDYPAVIGGGGPGGTYSSSGRYTNGGTGGASSFLGVTASGGSGATSASLSSNTPSAPGTGPNGNGGSGGTGTSGFNAQPFVGGAGGQGVKMIFSSFTETELSGGGGAGGSVATQTKGAGGSPGGGSGGAGGDSSAGGGIYDRASPGDSGVNGLGGGGGGGGAKSYRDDAWLSSIANGGAGGSGCVAVRMHLKSAS